MRIFKTKADVVMTVGLFFLAFAVRFAFIKHFGFSHFQASDSSIYDGLAMSILKGDGFILNGEAYFKYPPAYPVFLAVLYRFFSIKNHVAVLYSHMLLGGLTCGVIYYLGREFYNRLVGFIAGLISVFHISMVSWTGYVLSDTLFLFILTLSVLFLLKFQRERKVNLLILAGILIGVSALIRAVSLAILFCLIIWLVVIFEKEKVRLIKIVSIFVFSSLLVIGPWIVRNYVASGDFIPITMTGSEHLYKGIMWDEIGRATIGVDYIVPEGFDRLTTKEQNAFYLRESTIFIKNNPKWFKRLAFKKAKYFWLISLPEYSKKHKLFNYFHFGPIYMFALIGFLSLGRRWRFGFLVFIMCCAITSLCMVTFVDYDQRYRLPLEPFLNIIAAFGLVRIIEFFKVKNSRNKAIISHA